MFVVKLKSKIFFSDYHELDFELSLYISDSNQQEKNKYNMER